MRKYFKPVLANSLSFLAIKVEINNFVLTLLILVLIFTDVPTLLALFILIATFPELTELRTTFSSALVLLSARSFTPRCILATTQIRIESLSGTSRELYRCC
jgi:hypothetical protein